LELWTSSKENSNGLLPGFLKGVLDAFRMKNLLKMKYLYLKYWMLHQTIRNVQNQFASSTEISLNLKYFNAEIFCHQSTVSSFQSPFNSSVSDEIELMGIFLESMDKKLVHKVDLNPILVGWVSN